MRFSTRQDDPGFRNWAFIHGSRRLLVYLDGEPLPDVVTVDDRLGMALVQRRDANGQIVVNRARSEVVLDAVFGLIELEVGPHH